MFSIHAYSHYLYSCTFVIYTDSQEIAFPLAFDQFEPSHSTVLYCHCLVFVLLGSTAIKSHVTVRKFPMRGKRKIYSTPLPHLNKFAAWHIPFNNMTILNLLPCTVFWTIFHKYHAKRIQSKDYETSVHMGSMQNGFVIASLADATYILFPWNELTFSAL